MSALSDKGITLEGLAAAVDALRQELATWKALARKQDTLTAAQITATLSGATTAKIDQIAINTAAIQSLAAQVAGQISLAYVTTLPATGEPLTLYLVPQGDGTAPNYCNEYLWVNSAWELIGTTGSMANNGELTIQVNGVAVGTFTANQAANAAINITVPTDTSQLVNGAQYVDSAALQAALALKQNSLNTAQLEAVNSGITAALVTQIGTNQTAIAGKQDALTTAQQAAVDSGATVAKIDQIASNASAIVALTSSKQNALTTTQLAAVNSGVTAAAVQQIGTNASNISGLQTAVASKAADNSVVHLAGAETISGDKTFTGAVVTHNITPETDNTYSLGSSSLAWSAVYAGTYYYGGTAWGLDKYNQWTGVNDFNNLIGLNDAELWFKHPNIEDITTNPNTNTGKSILQIWNKGTTQYFGGIIDRLMTDGSHIFEIVCFGYPLNSTTPYQHRFIFAAHRDGGADFYPTYNGVVNLGTSGNKWKTLNGINPGALSFPSTPTVDIDTTNWDKRATNGVIGSVTPSMDGWLNVQIQRDVDFAVWPIGIYRQLFRAGVQGNGKYLVMIMIPVTKNVTVNLYTLPLGVSESDLTFAYHKFYPCLGNV